MRISALTILALASGAYSFSLVDSVKAGATKVATFTADHWKNNVGFKAMDAGVSTLEKAMSTFYFGGKSTYNDQREGHCGDVMIIFARGTGEPGNVGSFVGPPLLKEVQARFPGKEINLQGVDRDMYEGKVADYLKGLPSDGGSDPGADMMATYVEKMINICQTGSQHAQIVMSGWSQGAQVVHKAAKKLGASKMKAVGAVVTFGDPNFKDAVVGIDASKVKKICHSDDDICRGYALLKPTHFTYIQETGEAADFLVSALKLKTSRFFPIPYSRI